MENEKKEREGTWSADSSEWRRCCGRDRREDLLVSVELGICRSKLERGALVGPKRQKTLERSSRPSKLKNVISPPIICPQVSE